MQHEKGSKNASEAATAAAVQVTPLAASGAT